jgi:hypothetical protein
LVVLTVLVAFDSGVGGGVSGGFDDAGFGGMGADAGQGGFCRTKNPDTYWSALGGRKGQ